MIEISRANVALIYLAASLGFLLLVWVGHLLRARRTKLNPFEHVLLTCEFCKHVYLDEKLHDITKCPQCLSFNKNNLYEPKSFQ